MDKIVWLPDEITINNPKDSFSLTTPHGLGAVPYVKGVWSSDDWETTWPTNVTVNDVQVVSKQVSVSSDETNVYLSGIANVAGITLRLWGVFYEAATLDVVVPPTRDKSTNKFIINSDFNYPKLFMEGIADVTTLAQSITHDLGFVPQIDIWQRVGSPGSYRWEELNFDVLGTSDLAPSVVNVTDADLQFASGSGYFYYRIYADEA